jgi:hypothetical protein
MRRWLATVIVFLGLAGSAGAQDAGIDSRRDLPGAFTVNRPAYLYAAPSADAQIVTKLRPNTVIDVVEVREQWYKVQSATGKPPGWLRRSYADPAGVPQGDLRAHQPELRLRLARRRLEQDGDAPRGAAGARRRRGRRQLVPDRVGVREPAAGVHPDRRREAGTGRGLNGPAARRTKRPRPVTARR